VEWDQTYQTSKKTLQRLLKQPRRSLKSAVADVRRLSEADLAKAWALNEFQLEDVEEHIAEEELDMVSVPTPDLSGTGRYEKQMEEASGSVQKKIETRMTKKTVLALGGVMLGLYLAGFLPLIFGNFSAASARLLAVLLTGGAVVLLGAVAFVCLLFLRGSLRKRYRKYNEVMGEINQEIDGSMALFSRYLSHACNVMRGFSVLNFRRQTQEPDTVRIRILKKHMADIRRCREELQAVFGAYISPNADLDPAQVKPYPYDFRRPVDFSYPMPYTEGMRCQIEFMQPGNTIQVPVSFVRCITVRREELYD
jgi:hypothetical protein